MRFTVVIPTRERSDTLRACLQTCVAQDCDSLEILVSDNASQDNTAEVVHSFRDSRIRYLNTGQRLAMSQNWEFALSQVGEGFVFFLGDDDGLLPTTVCTAHRLLRDSGLPALAWRKALYEWPDSLSSRRNELKWPLGRRVETRESSQILPRVLRYDPRLGENPHLHLPGVYNGFIARSAIERARSRSGRFFCSCVPDLYAAIALAGELERYLFSLQPLSIGGRSGHSTGGALMRSDKKASIFFREENLPFHPEAEFAPSGPILLAEAVWQVRDNLPDREDLALDLEVLLTEALYQARTAPLASRPAIERAVATMALRHNLPVPRVSPLNPGRYRILWQRLEAALLTYRLNLARYQVSDVYQASQFCEKLAGRNPLDLWISALLARFPYLLEKLTRSNPGAEKLAYELTFTEDCPSRRSQP